jgi:hypothetical protein
LPGKPDLICQAAKTPPPHTNRINPTRSHQNFFSFANSLQSLKMLSRSVNNRRQERSSRFAVQSFTHQSHWLDHAQSVRQTPPEQFAVARRQQEPRSGESPGGADQGLQIFVVLGNGVPEEAY